jgi:hypothetical protein
VEIEHTQPNKHFKHFRKKQPVIFLPNESASSKFCKKAPKMSAFGYLSFVISVVNAVANAANNINNNQNNNNNNNNDNNNHNNNVNVANSNTNQNNMNTLMAGRELSMDERKEREDIRIELARHHRKAILHSKREAVQ